MVNGREITKNMRVEMPRGTGVSLLVSYKSGNPNTQVPIVVGKSLSEARYALWKSGLNVGDISFDSSVNLTDRRNARVYMQSVEPHKRVKYGQAVELYLSEDDALIDSLMQISVDLSKKNAAEAKKQVEKEEAERAAEEMSVEEDDVTTEPVVESEGPRYDLQVDASDDDYESFFGA
jgi:beta-lactam-binding protein with PASTA domain